MDKTVQTHQQSLTREWQEGKGATFAAWIKMEKAGVAAVKALKKAVHSPSNHEIVEESEKATEKWRAAV